MSRSSARAVAGVAVVAAALAAGCGDRSLNPSGEGGSPVGLTTGLGGGGGAPDGGNPGIGGAAVSACTPAMLTGATGQIAFDSDRSDFNRDIYTMNADGSGLTRLTTEPSIEKEPAFSPDGTRVSFSSDRSGTFQIYLLDLATMQVRQLTDQAGGADQSAFSHDGSLVAFHSGASVWVVHADGTGASLVATGLDTYNAYFWPHFSADDAELVFDRNNEIDAVHLDGSGFRRIVQNWTTTIKSPAVSPTGTEVAYTVWCDALSVWTTPFSTTTEPCKGRRVTPVGEPGSQRPAWGPNDFIVYERVDAATNVGSIAVISRNPGSVPCLLTPDLADNRNPAWRF